MRVRFNLTQTTLDFGFHFRFGTDEVSSPGVFLDKFDGNWLSAVQL